MKRLLILCTVCGLAALLTGPAVAQYVNLEVEDADIMAAFGKQFGNSNLDGGYPADIAGPGVRIQATPTVSSGWADLALGDDFPIANGIYGFPVYVPSSGFFGDWSGYTDYQASFTNNSATDWAHVKPYLNIGVAGTYWAAPGVWIAPGETKIETLDLTGITGTPNIEEISHFGVQLGTNYGSTNNYDGTHFDVTVSLAVVPNVAPDVSGICISTPTPCVTVPFVINRAADSTSMRGYSVTFSLSSELQLCSGVSSIVEGSYLSGSTSFQIVNNGGGSYTVDGVILGLPCGATAGTGTLFTADVSSSGSDGTGTITVTGVTARDCSNGALPGQPGLPGSITIDTTPPVAIGDLGAAQVKTGNDADGTTGITLIWSVESGASVAVYRKGFGSYPEYDDSTGAAPSAPTDTADAVASGWTLTGVTTSSGVDETDAERDFWYFVAFATDTCGNESGVSNRTDGTLNYHLGDVIPVVFAAADTFGNNAVGFLDISKLGAHYGTQDGEGLYLDTLDVGPTSDLSVDGLPSTDDEIQFEDLIMFAINYGDVSKPLPPAPAADRNMLNLIVDTGNESRIQAVIELASNGSVRGVSIPLKWNESMVEPIGFDAGELLDRQSGQAVLLSPHPGAVDAATLGASFRGEGRLATVAFRRLAPGDPGIGFGEVLARDAENKPVAIELLVSGGMDPALPMVTRLLPIRPNPFAAGAVIRFDLAQETKVSVHIYSVGGRLVRDLVNETLPRGEQNISWDGRDYAGRSVASGTYVVKMEAGSHVETRRVVRLR